MGLEIERKYLHIHLQNLRQKLVDCGAHCLGAHFESNWVYDSAEGGLVGGGQLLRLRTQQWRDNTRHLLTLKLPATHDGGFKMREERETEVADGAVMHSILEGLGYRVAARYEKIREPWHMDTVEVELDILPFAEVVELEGRAQDIESVERRLNLDNAEISTKSYHELHQEWLRQNHKPAQLSFVFDEAQGKHWRTELGLTDRPAANPASTRQS